MTDPEKWYLKDTKRNEQKPQLNPLGVVVFIAVYAVFIGVMLASVPKNAKWWLDSTPTWSSDR